MGGPSGRTDAGIAGSALRPGRPAHPATTSTPRTLSSSAPPEATGSGSSIAYTNARHPGLDQRVDAGRLLAMVSAGLERDIYGPAAGRVTRSGERHHFRVHTAMLRVPSFAHHGTVPNHHGADERVGMHTPPPSLGEGEGVCHRRIGNRKVRTRREFLHHRRAVRRRDRSGRTWSRARGRRPADDRSRRRAASRPARARHSGIPTTWCP